MSRTLGQMWSLYRIELTNWRKSWRSMVVLGIVGPVAAAVFLSAAGRPLLLADRQRICVGALLLATLMENFHRVCNHYAFMREAGILAYFRALPVSDGMILTAVTLSFFTLSIVPAAATYVFASAYLDLPLAVSPEAVLIIALAAIPLALLAAMLGSVARSGSEATALAGVATIALVSSGGILIDETRLPPLLADLGSINPLASTADALRDALYGSGSLQPQLLAPAALCAGVIVTSLLLGNLWRKQP